MGKEVVRSVAPDGILVCFENINFLSNRGRKPSNVVPEETKILNVF